MFLVNPYRFSAASVSGLLTDLIAYYKLGEATGSGDRVDSHASYDLTASTTITQGTGIIGNCAVISAGEYLSRSNDISTGTAARSFSLWAKMASDSSTRHFFSIGTGTSWDVIALSHLNATQIRAGYSGGNTIWTPDIDDNAWHHIVLTYPASAVPSDAKLYIDGVEESQTSTSGSTTIDLGATEFRVADSLTGGSELDGSIDELAVWGRELTSADVTALYNSGSGLAYESFD